MVCGVHAPRYLDGEIDLENEHVQPIIYLKDAEQIDWNAIHKAAISQNKCDAIKQNESEVEK